MQNKRRKKKSNASLYVLIVICIVLAVVIALLTFKLVADGNGQASSQASVSQSSEAQTEETSSSGSQDSSISEETPTPTPTATPTPLPAVVQLSPDSFISTYAYMVRVDDGSVVLDKNASATMYPASMTKIMTVLVAIENLPDLDEKLQISTETLAYLYEQNSSLAGFSEGEMVSVRDLLYGAMLPSGGEACLTLAVRVAGSEEAFAELMNQRAAQMGLSGTHFVNTSGLHNENHYTTCTDLAVIFQTALQNPTFYEIVTSASHTCEATEQHPEGLVLNSTVFSGLGNNVMDNGAVILGGKTGTTDEAGYCLATFGQYNEQTYMMITSHAPFDDTGVVGSFADAKTAYSALQ